MIQAIRIIISSIFLFLYSSFIVSGQIDLSNPPKLTESAVVSLITCAPGHNELWARFGHSAIRVVDHENDFDLVYNWGTFDFDTPGFYSKFVQGKLHYALSVYEFRYMVRNYRNSNQSIFEQQLDLTLEERQRVFDFINNNYKPENRYYLYDFFFDNCSSIIRDIFEKILGKKLEFKDSYIKEPHTFRQLIDQYLGEAWWGDFGIDLALGVPTDRVATSREYMFLPYEMMRAFGTASLRESHREYPFVRFNNLIFQEVNYPPDKVYLTPKVVFWSIFVLIFAITLLQLRKRKLWKWVDISFFTIIGLTGLLIAFIWFGTDHQTTKWNLNILWAFPVHIILPFYIRRNRFPAWLKFYLISAIGLIFIVLAGWNQLPQQLHSAIIPICFAIATRLGYLLWENYFTSLKPITI